MSEQSNSPTAPATPRWVSASYTAGLEARIKELEEQANGLHELFKVNQRDIREEVDRALGHEQTIDALGAVRRLAGEYAEVKARIAELQAEPRIMKYLMARDGKVFALYLSNGQKIKIQREGGAAWMQIGPTPIVRSPSLILRRLNLKSNSLQ